MYPYLSLFAVWKEELKCRNYASMGNLNRSLVKEELECGNDASIGIVDRSLLKESFSVAIMHPRNLDRSLDKEEL